MRIINSLVGVCSATQANKYSQEQLQLMKGQDIKYVALKSQAEAKVSCHPFRDSHYVEVPQNKVSSQTTFVAAGTVC